MRMLLMKVGNTIKIDCKDRIMDLSVNLKIKINNLHLTIVGSITSSYKTIYCDSKRNLIIADLTCSIFCSPRNILLVS